ncbi:MAG: undecaprenyl-diphosphate phosphatase [Peptoniphilaceae bacterium]|nr:undecaprenyl-diphosphate phosphatase [Peptoniphilaceae bacterium]MDY6086152.1 undecaprenyl-diphosphate phosphatase [Peptoniphilaceae bacterium]
MDVVTLFKVVILSLIEGITEFLPVSSTGHLILANAFVGLSPQEFANAFSVIIQLGAILAVVVLYWNRLNPWHVSDQRRAMRPRRYAQWNTQTRVYYDLTHPEPTTIALWERVIVGVLPAAVLGFLFDDLIDKYFMTVPVVAATLFIYGVAMIFIEKRNQAKGEPARFTATHELPLAIAFQIGLYQCLALIPGTSRSAATIIGAMLLGTSRVAAAEFSFFLAIPTMLGATFLKVVKNLGSFTLGQWGLIALGFFLSFVVAYVVIRKFMDYVRRHDFTPFGVYRIVLSVVLVVWMALGRG